MSMNALKITDPVLQQPDSSAAKPAESKAVPEASSAIVAQEIAAAVWPAFCASFSNRCHGVCTTVERVEGPGQGKIECIDRPFDQLLAVVLENGVTAIHVTVGTNSKRRTFAAPGPRWVRLHYNAAGIPTILEIGYSEGTLTLRFTGPIPAGPAFTANSWGE